jgi:hypothetical protein
LQQDERQLENVESAVPGVPGQGPFPGAETVNPMAAMFVMLDELRISMDKVREAILEDRGEGKVTWAIFSVTGGSSGAFVQPQPRLSRSWISVSITNDGPDTSWFQINGDEWVELRINEVQDIEMKRPAIHAIRFYTKAGLTATGRLTGKY